MGILDKFKDQAVGLKKKATTVVDQNSDKIQTGLDKAGDFVDQKTKGKYSDKIGKAKGAAEKGLDKLDRKDDDFPPAPGEAAPRHAHERSHEDGEAHSHPHGHDGEHRHDHPQP